MPVLQMYIHHYMHFLITPHTLKYNTIQLKYRYCIGIKHTKRVSPNKYYITNL